MTAGIDLALAMIEQDLVQLSPGPWPETVFTIARRRPVAVPACWSWSPIRRIQNALAYAKRNLNSKLTVKQLANAAHLSPRQFSRAFARDVNPPAKAVEELRARPPPDDGDALSSSAATVSTESSHRLAWRFDPRSRRANGAA